LIELLQTGYKARVAVRSEAAYDRIRSLAPLQPYLSQIETIVVPDIVAPGAYDKAVKGVEHVIHVASPTFASDTIKDFEKDVIEPAVKGTVGMLDSVAKEAGVKRVVITSSALAIASFQEIMSGEQIDGM
jgi:nucleoside-diphosphate-sugar epimerase